MAGLQEQTRARTDILVGVVLHAIRANLRDSGERQAVQKMYGDWISTTETMLGKIYDVLDAGLPVERLASARLPREAFIAEYMQLIKTDAVAEMGNAKSNIESYGEFLQTLDMLHEGHHTERPSNFPSITQHVTKPPLLITYRQAGVSRAGETGVGRSPRRVGPKPLPATQLEMQQVGALAGILVAQGKPEALTQCYLAWEQATLGALNDLTPKMHPKGPGTLKPKADEAEGLNPELAHQQTLTHYCQRAIKAAAHAWKTQNPTLSDHDAIEAMRLKLVELCVRAQGQVMQAGFAAAIRTRSGSGNNSQSR